MNKVWDTVMRGIADDEKPSGIQRATRCTHCGHLAIDHRNGAAGSGCIQQNCKCMCYEYDLAKVPYNAVPAYTQEDLARAKALFEEKKTND